MKLSAAMVLFAAIVAALIAMPTPPPTPPDAAVPAAPVTVAKADRPSIQPAGSPCARQNWPNFNAACLRYTNDKQTVRDIRTVGDKG